MIGENWPLYIDAKNLKLSTRQIMDFVELLLYRIWLVPKIHLSADHIQSLQYCYFFFQEANRIYLKHTTKTSKTSSGVCAVLS